MTDIRPDILEEVEDCVRRIKVFQEVQGRRIHRDIKRSRKGRAGIAELAEFGLPIPEDFRALYWNYNGTKPSDRITIWESNVFLDLDWWRAEALVRGNKITRIEGTFYSSEKLVGFLSLSGISFDLFPGRACGEHTPLVANLGALSKKTLIAFDSTLAMLRSVCAAQDAGILRYQEARLPPSEPQGRAIEKGEIRYDLKELWDVIRPFNPRAEYWPAAIAGPIDWEEIELPKPEIPGVITLHPEVSRLMFGAPEDHRKAAEEEMRRAGVFDSDDPEALLDARDERLWREAAEGTGYDAGEEEDAEEEDEDDKEQPGGGKNEA